tara:strand:+ start:166 stop:753 length:588 start_codon:yes stop_codon:yes gene_type:complete
MREKRKVGVPSDWSGISIKMYQDFEKIKKKKLEESEYNLEVLGAICGLDRDMASQLEVKSLKKIFKTIEFMTKEMPNTKELIKKVEWNDKKYGIIPNFSEISMGEYIDIEEHCKDAQKNLHKIMSILYRPIVKETRTRYSIEPYAPNEELEQEYLDFPIIPSVSALNFFFHLGKILPNALGKFLRKELMKQGKQA